MEINDAIIKEKLDALSEFNIDELKVMLICMDGYKEEINKLKENKKLKEENKKYKGLYVKKSKEARLWKKKYDETFYECLENPNYELKLYEGCEYDEDKLWKGLEGTNELRLGFIKDDEDYDGNPPITMCWDWKNDELNRFFQQHYSIHCIYGNNYYYDFKWMDFIKEKFGWEKGNVLKINTKSNSDGYMNFWKINYETEFGDFIIDENGFILHTIYETEYKEWMKDKKNKYIILNCEYNYKLSQRLEKENK